MEERSRREVTWNAFILPVLTVFKETVACALPGAVWDEVTRDFADAVNGVRDAQQAGPTDRGCERGVQSLGGWLDSTRRSQPAKRNPSRSS